MDNFLPLNLQFFGGEGRQDSEEIDEITTPAEAQKTETDEEIKKVDTKIPYERFKAKVDEVNALKKELDNIKKQQEAQETKELEEQQKYKELYEQSLQKLEQMKGDALNTVKDALLVQAGYSQDQTELLRKLVTGETDGEIKQSIEELKKTIPVAPTYADPSPMNGQRETPKAVDGEEEGRSRFQRLLDGGKLRGFKK